MREKWSRRGLVAFACVALSIFASRALAWSGSCTADEHCYCSGTLDPALARMIVPAPVGGQSIAVVCERIGAGPRWNLEVVHSRRVRESVAEVVRQLEGAGTIGAVAAPPVLAGAVPELASKAHRQALVAGARALVRARQRQRARSASQAQAH